MKKIISSDLPPITYLSLEKAAMCSPYGIWALRRFIKRGILSSYKIKGSKTRAIKLSELNDLIESSKSVIPKQDKQEEN